MKKLITTISALFFVATVSAKADVGIGIAGAMHLLDGSGAETTRQSGQVNKGSHDETASVPEFFIEAIGDDGVLAMVSLTSQQETWDNHELTQTQR